MNLSACVKSWLVGSTKEPKHISEEFIQVITTQEVVLASHTYPLVTPPTLVGVASVGVVTLKGVQVTGTLEHFKHSLAPREEGVARNSPRQTIRHHCRSQKSAEI